MVLSLHLGLHGRVLLHGGLGAVVPVGGPLGLGQVVLLVHRVHIRAHCLGLQLRLGVGSLLQVLLLVVVKVAGGGKSVATHLALVRFLACVDSLVDLQVRLLREVLPAVGAIELHRFLVVFFNVSFQISLACKLDATVGALRLQLAVRRVLLSNMFVIPGLPSTCELAILTLEFLCTMTLNVM